MQNPANEIHSNQKFMQSRILSELAEMLKTDEIQISMADRSPFRDVSERDVRVYASATAVMPVAFGELSNVTPILQVRSGQCNVNEKDLNSRDNRAMLSALRERIEEIRREKAEMLLCELPERAQRWSISKFDPALVQESLLTKLHSGSRLTITNNSEPHKLTKCPIYLNINTTAAKNLGIEGFTGFYHSEADRAVLTDGTFFIVSHGGGLMGDASKSWLAIYSKLPRFGEAGILSQDSSRRSLIEKTSGEIARQVHFALKTALECQIQEVGKTGFYSA